MALAGGDWRVYVSAAQCGKRVGNRDTGMKKLIVYDLDGTLAESKSPLDDEMAELLHNLLDVDVYKRQA